MATNVRFFKIKHFDNYETDFKDKSISDIVGNNNFYEEAFYLNSNDGSLYLGNQKLSNAQEVQQLIENFEQLYDFQREITTTNTDGTVTTETIDYSDIDKGKAIRTIAIEELSYQLLSDKAEADFKTLQELGAWIEDHPESVAEMNFAIQNNADEIDDIQLDIMRLDVQPDWELDNDQSHAYIQNKPNVKSGSGEKSLVIGDGDAKGKNSIAGGSNDSDEINKVKKMAQLAGYNIDTDIPISYGDGSLSLGVGTKAYSMGSMVIGVSSSAGVKGFYWHSIDWSGENPIIQLSTEQKPYRYYSLFGQKIEQNKKATWNTEAGALLSSWVVGDKLTIVNNNKYGEGTVITSIDTTNGKITVESLPFAQTDVKVEFSSLSDITKLVLSFDDFSIYNPSKPNAGILEFAYGALSLGLMTNASGSFSTALGYNTKVTTDFGHAEGRDTIAGYASHAEGENTIASGNHSHAEGWGSKALGKQSHAEGESTEASGEQAHAEGYKTVASGLNSHAEGSSTVATNDDSHAEGKNTTASGVQSHAEGEGTIASGNDSHAEGCNTIAQEAQSHAEGWGSKALGKQSHAEGDSTEASGEQAHAEGRQTKAIGISSHAEGENTIASGNNSHAEGYGSKASGIQSHAEGNSTIASGKQSHAEGYNTIASGKASHAEGENTIASSEQSHAEGYSSKASGKQSHAEGYSSTASGAQSHAEGCNTIAEKAQAHAEGWGTKALGNQSHAEGDSTTASGEDSHAEGNNTTASGGQSHAEGYKTVASGSSSHAEGVQTVASGGQSHAEGWGCIASGKQSHAEGDSTEASGEQAHAEGYKTVAIGYCAHAEGSETSASYCGHAEGNNTEAGIFSHAEGDSTIASGVSSHAEGNGTTASELSSHAEGYGTTASGLFSHAEGNGTIASGQHSHSEGYCTIASGSASHVQGQYNIDDVDENGNPLNTYAHIVGGGDDVTPSNLHTIRWSDGQGFFRGGTTSTGADYAEFFEWIDGNPDSEDRVGLLVALDGDKIKLANTDDDILGIISGTAAVLGDNYECEWNGKYLTDDFGRIIYDTIEEFIDVEHVTFNEIKKEITDEETQETRIEIELEEVKIIEKQSLGFWKRPKLNPNYNSKQSYINRSNRPEWDAVGMLGKLYVRDDGTAVVNEYITVRENGVATASSEKTNMRVLSRVNDNIIRVLLK